MRFALAALLGTVAAIGLAQAGCRSKSEAALGAEAGVNASSAHSASRNRPKTSSEFATTNAAIALGNLDAQISELTRLTKARPESLLYMQKLSAAHHTRGRYRDDLDEIALGIEEATLCIQLAPADPSGPLMRAEQEQSLHRFREARADLARARELGATDDQRKGLETELDWNDGLYDKPIAAIRAARLQHPTTATWMREAQLDHDLGLEDESDAAFERAEDLVVDTAPLPLAHLNVQRGIQKYQRGLLEEASVFFRESVARMPAYIAGLDHLAESLHGLGKDEEATAIYEKVITLTDDPEFSHALADLYAKHGKAAPAAELEAKAHAGYERLLKAYPEAMYWHASEYYLSIGEKETALALLEKNLTLRPNSGSYVALAHAQILGGHVAEAKVSIDRALAMPLKSALLFATAAAVYKASGDAASAAGYRERAQRMNPRIADDDIAKIW